MGYGTRRKSISSARTDLSLCACVYQSEGEMTGRQMELSADDCFSVEQDEKITKMLLQCFAMFICMVLSYILLSYHTV